MTFEEIQLAIAEGQLAASRLVQASQVHAAKNYEAETLANRQRVEAERDTGIRVAVRTDQQTANYMRPSFVFKPALERFGDDEWEVSYGALTAQGPTPEIAHQEFDRIWVGGDEL